MMEDQIPDIAVPETALPPLSDDQSAAWETVSARLAAHGIDLAAGRANPPTEKTAPAEIMAVTGKAGSGKTVLLAGITRRLEEMDLLPVTTDWEPRRQPHRRSFAVLAPTNKAASVLRRRGVKAVTLHRILYTPVYDPAFQKVADWLEGKVKTRPEGDALAPEQLDRAERAYAEHGSVPGALAAAGVRGADFITGWTRREDPLDVALVDEASMLDSRQVADLQEIFRVVVLFGDPAQLAPIMSDGKMAFDALPEARRSHLGRIHRQAGDSPIVSLAHALADPDVDFKAFEGLVREAAAKDDRVQVTERVDADLMRESPVLVWRNKTRIRLIGAFRAAHQVPGDRLVPGEPLVCDGLELPLKQRRKRAELEARGLIKGALATYLGPGRKPGFARVHMAGSEEPGVSVAAIIQLESPDDEEPRLLVAARMGAVFLHGAASTIHKAQGSQWPSVQVFAPDLSAAAWAGQVEAGIPLWKRLAYVAITRAEERLLWIVRNRVARPAEPLGLAAEGS